MKPRSWLALVCLLAAALALWALVGGGAWLESLSWGGLPAGNALAAIVLCALAGAGLLASRARTWGRAWAWCAFAAALAWLPLSIAVAGNLALNFQGTRGDAWLLMSTAVFAMGGLSLAWALLAAIGARRSRKR